MLTHLKLDHLCIWNEKFRILDDSRKNMKFNWQKNDELYIHYSVSFYEENQATWDLIFLLNNMNTINTKLNFTFMKIYL